MDALSWPVTFFGATTLPPVLTLAELPRLSGLLARTTVEVVFSRDFKEGRELSDESESTPWSSSAVLARLCLDKKYEESKAFEDVVATLLVVVGTVGGGEVLKISSGRLCSEEGDEI